MLSNLPGDHLPADDVPAGEGPADDVPAGEGPANDVSAGEDPVNGFGADDVRADGVRADGVRADGVRADDVPADDAAGTGVAADDVVAVSRQLGRPARGIRSIAHRCTCGLPDVVETEPRLPDGTPFPTTFYLTCPRLASAIGRLEAGGVMKDMTERLATDEDLAARYRAAHESYLARREAIAHVPEIDGISAGGMPTRVKCLHVLVGQSLAQGPGVNPLGDEALAALPDWGRRGPCVSTDGAVVVTEPVVGTETVVDTEAGVGTDD